MKLQFKFIFAFVFCTQSVFLFSQNLPAINKTGKKPEYFIPKGWEIIVTSGKGTVKITTHTWASGVYFYTLEADRVSFQWKKMALIK